MIKIVDMPRRTGKTESAIEALDNNDKAIMLVPNLKHRDTFFHLNLLLSMCEKKKKGLNPLFGCLSCDND